jgi:DNA gyrase subunit A
MINLLALDEGERITSILPVREYAEDQFIFMATANGTVKKTPLTQFARPRSSGLIALDLVEGDHLVGTAVTDGDSDVMLFSSAGKAVRFSEVDVRAMGRTSRGVRGIRLDSEQAVISMVIPKLDGKVLTVSENGFGKRTLITEYATKGRGGKGMIAMQCSERNGPVIGVVQVFDGDEIMMISDQGTLVRTRVDEVSLSGRNTQGVRVIRVKTDEHVIGVERIQEPEVVILEQDGSTPDASGQAASDQADSSQDGSNEDDLSQDDKGQDIEGTTE